MVIGSEQPTGGLVIDGLCLPQSLPEILCRGEDIQVIIATRQKIMLDDPLAVRRVGELQAEDLRVFFRLLEAVSRMLVNALRFDNGDGKILPVAKEVVCPFLWTPLNFVSGKDNATISECLLFAYLFI